MFGYGKNVYVFFKRENMQMLPKRIPNCYNSKLADASKRIPNCYNYTLADASKRIPNCYNYTLADACLQTYSELLYTFKKVIKCVKGIKHFIIMFLFYNSLFLS